jgi:hypothetical protein
MLHPAWTRSFSSTVRAAETRSRCRSRRLTDPRSTQRVPGRGDLILPHLGAVI